MSIYLFVLESGLIMRIGKGEVEALSDICETKFQKQGEHVY